MPLCRSIFVFVLAGLAGCALVANPARDRERAIIEHSEAIQKDPGDARAFNRRGIARMSLGDIGQAIADFDQAIRIDPAYADAYVNRGIARSARDEVDRAIEDYSHAIRLDPRLSYAFNDRGVAWRHKGDLARAVADYDEAIRLNPDNIRALANRGRARFYRGQFESARRDFARAHRLDPQNATHLIWLYLALARGGSEQAAEAALEQGMKALKGFQWPAVIADLFRGRTDAAALAERVAASDVAMQRYRVCETRFYIGQWYLLRSMTREARALLSRAVRECPADADAHDGAVFELGRLAAGPPSLAQEGDGRLP
jgi:lipoprotein NlpI